MSILLFYGMYIVAEKISLHLQNHARPNKGDGDIEWHTWSTIKTFWWNSHAASFSLGTCLKRLNLPMSDRKPTTAFGPWTTSFLDGSFASHNQCWAFVVANALVHAVVTGALHQLSHAASTTRRVSLALHAALGASIACSTGAAALVQWTIEALLATWLPVSKILAVGARTTLLIGFFIFVLLHQSIVVVHILHATKLIQFQADSIPSCSLHLLHMNHPSLGPPKWSRQSQQRPKPRSQRSTETWWPLCQTNALRCFQRESWALNAWVDTQKRCHIAQFMQALAAEKAWNAYGTTYSYSSMACSYGKELSSLVGNVEGMTRSKRFHAPWYSHRSLCPSPDRTVVPCEKAWCDATISWVSV